MGQGESVPVKIVPAGRWVLIKGWLDNGSIDGAFGPFTGQRARWLRDNMLDNSSYNWTLIELDNGDELEPGEPVPEPEVLRYVAGYNTRHTGQHEVLIVLGRDSFELVMFAPSQDKARAIVMILNAPEA